ncbi:sulfite exporter TauE/SafE family protein [Indioceanicola profundi]|uniref:sulfite exporter TauE/SafE family protein n=1 Tax=Indioceanicola profundi TaxID=2220096 RepID=UPI000E6AAC3E|nr:sulfite exporter TauE/SafE family protein [Indioceanicola profundi]
MELWDIVLLSGAGLIAGLVNAVAGGGTFFTFSALVGAGIPPIAANATSAVAVWPGNVASAAAYRTEVMRDWRHFAWMGLISLIGGAIGAVILLLLEDAEFRQMVPWLLLLATVLFALSPKITAFFRRQAVKEEKENTVGSPVSKLVGGIIQFVVSIYGGFFGAGMGILMLASLSITEGDDFHRINAAKVVFSVLINGIAIALFIAEGIVHWPAALIVMVACIIGGYLGVVIAKRIPASYVRFFVVAVGTLLTIVFFIR